MPRHIKKDDEVIVTAGDHKGQTGKVIRVDTKHDRVYVEGVNLVIKHRRRNPQTGQEGGIVTREGPIHISNVSPMADGKPTRVRFPRKDNGQKVRVAARNGAEIDTVSAPKPNRAGGGG